MHVTCSDFSSAGVPTSSGAAAGAWAVLAAVVNTATPDPADIVGALLASRLAEIPGARWASITQRHSETDLVTIAASADIARQVDDVQYELGQGPGLEAAGGRAVAAHAATLRLRWPEVAKRVVAETPVRSVLSQPLLPTVALGSLNIYSECPDGFAPPALIPAAEVAAACGLALVAVRERVRADNLLLALDSSRHIGAAIGILMALSRCTYEQAFDRMRIASQRTHRKLREVAEDIVLTGAIPEQ